MFVTVMTVIYSADLWDGKYVTYGSMGLTPASDETEAIEKSKLWAKGLNNVPNDAWLRVNINDVITSFRLADIQRLPTSRT
jgi:hypothetical protein